MTDEPPEYIMRLAKDALHLSSHQIFRGDAEALIARVIMAERANLMAEYAEERHDAVVDRASLAEAREELATLRAENERLREALVPFAEYPAATDTRLPGDMRVTAGSPMAARQCTVADFRRARAALKGGE